MALDLSLTPFFNTDEFAVNCTLQSAAVIKVILSTPDQEVFDQASFGMDAKATAKTSDVTALTTESTVVIGGTAYSIKKILAIDDGLLTDLHLMRA